MISLLSLLVSHFQRCSVKVFRPVLLLSLIYDVINKGRRSACEEKSYFLQSTPFRPVKTYRGCWDLSQPIFHQKCSFYCSFKVPCKLDFVLIYFEEQKWRFSTTHRHLLSQKIRQRISVCRITASTMEIFKSTYLFYIMSAHEKKIRFEFLSQFL